MKRQLLCQIEIQLCGFITFRDAQIDVDQKKVDAVVMAQISSTSRSREKQRQHLDAVHSAESNHHSIVY